MSGISRHQGGWDVHAHIVPPGVIGAAECGAFGMISDRIIDAATRHRIRTVNAEAALGARLKPVSQKRDVHDS